MLMRHAQETAEEDPSPRRSKKAPFCSIAQTVAHLLILRLTFYIPPHSSLFFAK